MRHAVNVQFRITSIFQEVIPLPVQVIISRLLTTGKHKDFTTAKTLVIDIRLAHSSIASGQSGCRKLAISLFCLNTVNDMLIFVLNIITIILAPADTLPAGYCIENEKNYGFARGNSEPIFYSELNVLRNRMSC